VLEGDVEEVAGAAGGIEHADRAELVVECLHVGDGGGACAGGLMLGGGGADGVPARAERVDDGRLDEALDVAARGVVCAELVTAGGSSATHSRRWSAPG
jgi:hypothetical protein